MTEGEGVVLTGIGVDITGVAGLALLVELRAGAGRGALRLLDQTMATMARMTIAAMNTSAVVLTGACEEACAVCSCARFAASLVFAATGA